MWNKVKNFLNKENDWFLTNLKLVSILIPILFLIFGYYFISGLEGKAL